LTGREPYGWLFLLPARKIAIFRSCPKIAYRDSLGDAFIYFREEDNDWYFHQGVLTMELLRYYCECPVQLVPWSTYGMARERQSIVK
jgi:hypothetical protein